VVVVDLTGTEEELLVLVVAGVAVGDEMMPSSADFAVEALLSISSSWMMRASILPCSSLAAW
jgi:hypothetical protein